MKKVAFLAIMIPALFSIYLTIATGEDDTPPFIYHYSIDNQAFVIERADGMHHEILTDFPSEVILFGPGWSPSRQWFAWTTYPLLAGAPDQDSNAYLVRSDTPEGITRVDDNGYVRSVRWSPSHDFLLVERYQVTPNEELLEYYVLDVNRGEISFKIDEKELNLESSSQAIEQQTEADWTPNGDNLAIYFPSDPAVENSYVMRVVSREGDLLGERLVRAESGVESGLSPSCLPQWSLNGHVIYTDPSGNIVVDNFADNQQIEVQTNEDLGYIQFADWSPDNTHALVYVDTSCKRKVDFMPSRDSHNLYLLSIESGTFSLIAEHAIPPHISERSISTVIDFYNKTTWSADSHWAHFTEGNNLFLLNSETGAREEITSFPASETPVAPEIISWLPDDTLLYLSHDFDNLTLSQYFPNTNQRVEIITSAIVSPNFVVSPNGKKVAFASIACDGVCVLTIATGEVAELGIQYQDKQGLDQAHDILWDDESEWLFMTGPEIGVGHNLNVANSDTGFVRDLGSSVNVPASYGWLPSLAN